MPLEVDYEFGKRAVSTGRLQQDQLEECVEILVALERVGSKQRLWAIVQRKGYMSDEAITAVRGSVESVAPGEAPAAEETAEDLRLPLRHAQGFVLAHVRKDGKAKTWQLPARLVTIGKDASCDIVLSEPGVMEQHARLNFREETYAIEEAAPGCRVVVNDQRVHSGKLAPYDLVELGGALLLFLPEYGDQPVVEPTDLNALNGTVLARLRIEDGPRKGSSFFLGAAPLVIGRHALANVRLKEPAVAEFHAHVARSPQGVRVVDLQGPGGTKVNGIRVTRQVLKEGDNLSVGPAALAVHLLAGMDDASALADMATGPAVVGKFAPAKTPDSPERAPDWDIASEVEVEPASDPFMRRGMEPVREEPAARGPAKAYAAGQLRLLCAEGPLEGKRFVVARDRFVIGREEGLDLTIPDVAVSRRHAEISLGAKLTEVRDLESRNGVFVNGVRVTVSPLRAGDTLRIHKSLFIVEEVMPRTPPPRMK